jgi:hypothetical protein
MPGVPLTKASPIPPPGPIRVKYRIRSSCSTRDMWIAGQLLGLWNGSLRTAHTQYSFRLTNGSRSNGSNALTWSCSKKRCGAVSAITWHGDISQRTSSDTGRDERKPKTHPWRKLRSRRCAMGSSLPYGGDTCWTRTSQSHTKDRHRYSRRQSAQGMVSGTYHRVVLLSIW